MSPNFLQCIYVTGSMIIVVLTIIQLRSNALKLIQTMCYETRMPYLTKYHLNIKYSTWK